MKIAKRDLVAAANDLFDEWFDANVQNVHGSHICSLEALARENIHGKVRVCSRGVVDGALVVWMSTNVKLIGTQLGRVEVIL